MTGFIRFRKLVGVAGICVLVAVGLLAFDTFRADWAYFKAEKALAIFRGQGEDREEIYLRRAENNIREALDVWPRNPDYLTLSASILVWRAIFTGDQTAVAQAYRDAVVLLRRALEIRPSSAYSWALVAEYKAKAGDRDAEMFLAREKALELGGADVELVNRMLRL